MSIDFDEITCMADPKRPDFVRISATLTAPLPAGHIVWSEISSHGKRSPGPMKIQAGIFRRNPVAMPDDPVTVKLSIVEEDAPRRPLVQAEQTFDLGRQTVI